NPGILRRLSHTGRLWRKGRPGGLAADRGRRLRLLRRLLRRLLLLLRAAPRRKGRLGLGNRREQRFGRAGRCRTRRRHLPRLGGGSRRSLPLIAKRGEGPPGENPETARLAELTGHGRPAARAGVATAGHELSGCVMLPGHARARERTADSRPANVTEVTTRRVVALWAHCPHTRPFEPTIPLGSSRAGYVPR